MLSGVGESELQLARSDAANFLHARAASHCQSAIGYFTRSVVLASMLKLATSLAS